MKIDTSPYSSQLISTYLAVIVIIFLSFLSYYNSNILFNHIGNSDPFWYVGIGLYYHLADYSNDYYKISRLPWNILQFLARQILQPAAATFVLQAVCYSTGSIALFLLFREIVGKSKSFIIGALYIFVPVLQASSAGADGEVLGLLGIWRGASFAMCDSATGLAARQRSTPWRRDYLLHSTPVKS